jgi:hypothetical protein
LITGFIVALAVFSTLYASGCLITIISAYIEIILALSSIVSHFDKLLFHCSETVITHPHSFNIAVSKLSLVLVDGS